MHYSDLVSKLLSDMDATVKRLRVALATDPAACIDDVFTSTLESLTYPYRCGELNQAARDALPGITTTRIHAQMRAMGYHQHRDQYGIAWITGRVTAAPAPPATPQPDL